MRRGILFACFALCAGPATNANAETIRITIDKLTFFPTEFVATVGDTIEWVNLDILDHTATAKNGDWDVRIAAGEVKRMRIESAGTVDYYCIYHPNMTGRVSVKPE